MVNSRTMITQGVFNDETAVISSRTVITQGVFDDESKAAAVIRSRKVITQGVFDDKGEAAAPLSSGSREKRKKLVARVRSLHLASSPDLHSHILVRSIVSTS